MPMDNFRFHLQELENCFEELLAENLQLKEKDPNVSAVTLGHEELTEEANGDILLEHQQLYYQVEEVTEEAKDDIWLEHQQLDYQVEELSEEENDDILQERQPGDYQENAEHYDEGAAMICDMPAHPIDTAPDFKHDGATPAGYDIPRRHTTFEDEFVGRYSLKSTFENEYGMQSFPVRRDSSESQALASQSVAVSKAPSLLPLWFQTTQRISSCDNNTTESPSSYVHLLEILDNQGSMKYAPNNNSRCVMSSFGNIRGGWDMIWRYVLALDIWTVSLNSIFVSMDHTPFALEIFDYFTVVFFATDIILNFHTSIIKDRMEIFNKTQIATEYLKFWFWVDVAATIPWDTLMDLGSGGKGLQMARSFKIAKSIKLIKMTQLIRIAKVWKYSEQKTSQAQMSKAADRVRKDTSARIKHLTEFARFLKVQFFLGMLAILAVIAHANCCIFALVHPQGQQWREQQDDAAIFKCYLESFWWAVTQLTFGSTYVANTPSHWALELAITCQRLILCFCFVEHVVYKSLLAFEDDARTSIKQAESLSYLKEHDVSLDTQIQILHYIKETGQVRKRQRWFQQLMDNDLPPEMQHFLCEELWSAHLLTLGLVRYVSDLMPHFLTMLSHEVSEQVFPRHGVVCREGDMSICAYYIMEGELVILFRDQYDQGVPPFGSGMWVGEKALVNPELRRSGTVATRSASTLLVVPAQAFRALLNSLDLENEFRKFCAEELWMGLCGRCGAVGQHWPTECPENRSSQRWLSNDNRGKLLQSIGTFGTGSMGSASASMDTSPKFGQDLKLYIDYHRLHPALVSVLEDCDVLTLKDLEANQAAVREALVDMEVYTEDLNIFTRNSIQNFRKIMAAKINDLFSMKATSTHHWLFLSHYKVEAGTEAALMRSEIQTIIDEDGDHGAHVFDAPVYLDSENLTDLHDLMQAVARSHNIVLICTKNVLLRPWCLIEIATAMRENIPILPIQLQKVGCEFVFPDDDFYMNLQNGELLGQAGIELLAQHGFKMEEVCEAIQKVFMRIALTYSPHRSADIRKAEMVEFLKHCPFRNITVRPPPSASPSHARGSPSRVERFASHVSRIPSYVSNVPSRVSKRPSCKEAVSTRLATSIVQLA